MENQPVWFSYADVYSPFPCGNPFVLFISKNCQSHRQNTEVLSTSVLIWKAGAENSQVWVIWILFLLKIWKTAGFWLGNLKRELHSSIRVHWSAKYYNILYCIYNTKFLRKLILTVQLTNPRALLQNSAHSVNLLDRSRIVFGALFGPIYFSPDRHLARHSSATEIFRI